ncbi:MAG TPA: MBOAT family protein [Cytophagales bacterium]|jgi:alginate O-acetyltransferase complex protein AlgI|nr:MBOAT family protein [Cytophagales bacterium]
MLFTSFIFILLLVVTFGLYYLPWFKYFQVYILVVSSFIFYAYNEPILLLLLIFSPAVNILTSYYITYGTRFNKKAIAILGVAVELAVLTFFKYSPLFSRTFFGSTSSVGHFLLMIPLPIGISFFTFEGISLVIDVYSEKYFDRKKYVSTSLFEHAKNIYCFISFFPHLIAGPIVKAHDFLPQIKSKTFTDIDWQSAFRTLVTGYFLKMVVADNLKDFTFWIEYPYFLSAPSSKLIMMLIGYSCQIFADFAGYSLIAIGLAKLFGYNLMSNFNFPYISSSFKEFWKRWHISLSSYLMEYLYIPLGGNKKGKVRTYIHLMVTMLLGGLWHGASWSYAVWGGFHGFALAAERLLADFFKLKHNFFIIFLKRIIVFAFVTLAWLLFKLTDFSHVIMYMKSLVNNWSMSSNLKESMLCMNIFYYSLPVFCYHALYLFSKSKHYYIFKRVEFLAYGIMLFFILTNSGEAGSFIYFQF